MEKQRTYYAEFKPLNETVYVIIKFDNIEVAKNFFGSHPFREIPREKDYKKAKAWALKYLKRIKENTIHEVTIDNCI